MITYFEIISEPPKDLLKKTSAISGCSVPNTENILKQVSVGPTGGGIIYDFHKDLIHIGKITIHCRAIGINKNRPTITITCPNYF
jgi:hypothetical protein